MIKKNKISKKIEQSILFTEVGQKFGYGHLMRSLALINELGYPVILNVVTDLGSDALKKLVYTNLIKKPKNSITINIISKHPNVCNNYDNLENSIFIVDSYHAPQSLYNESKLFYKSIFFDDYFRIEYPEGPDVFIINPMAKIFYSSLKGPKKDKFEKLLNKNNILHGINYQILRPAFIQNKSDKKKLSKNGLFICFGGANLTQEQQSLVLGLAKHLFPMKIDLVVSQNQALLMTKQNDKANLKIHNNINADGMSKLMQTNRLGLVCGGQLLLECAASGLACIVIKGAENQDYNIQFMQDKNLLLDSHSFDESFKLLIDKISTLIQNIPETTIESISKKAAKTITGKGCENIIKEVLYD